MQDQILGTGFNVVPSSKYSKSKSKTNKSKLKTLKDVELAANYGRETIDDEITPLKSILKNVKQVVLNTNIRKLRCCTSSFETIVSKGVEEGVKVSKVSNESCQLFKSKTLNENHIELEGTSSKTGQAILQYTYSIKRNKGGKQLLIDVLSFPNLTHSKWDILGKVTLDILGASSGSIEVIDSYGFKIYQIDDLLTMNEANIKAIKKTCIEKSLDIGLNILNRDKYKVGKIFLLGDVVHSNDSSTADRMAIDRYQSRITFPVEEDCLHKEEHRALLLAIPGICRWYFRRKQCKNSYKMI